MEKYSLNDMFKGWFIGNFEPTLYKTDDVEVGIKKYKAGDHESAHHHKIATEFTVVLNGEVEMGGQRYCEGDIIKVGEIRYEIMRIEAFNQVMLIEEIE